VVIKNLLNFVSSGKEAKKAARDFLREKKLIKQMMN